MTKRGFDGDELPKGEIVHLAGRRRQKSISEQVAEGVELTISSHFREQNELLRTMNCDLGAKVQRLTAGIEQLVNEMHGVRTGKKDEAFARVGPSGASPDLPTVAAEAALIYTLTSGEIGKELGFRASEIGTLLGDRGLGWAGNGDYQELGRHKKKTQQKFWHREVTDRLIAVLDGQNPSSYKITDKSVLAVFRKWQKMKADRSLLEKLTTNAPPH